MGSPSVKAEYGLSPMQSGMLFEALLHAEHGPDGGYNVEQLHIELSERVDPQVFDEAGLGYRAMLNPRAWA